MQNRCPFLMGHACYGEACMMWRVSEIGRGYCGVGGAPSAFVEPALLPSPTIGVPAVAADKKTTNGAPQHRQKR